MVSSLIAGPQRVEENLECDYCDRSQICGVVFSRANICAIPLVYICAACLHAALTMLEEVSHGE